MLDVLRALWAAGAISAVLPCAGCAGPPPAVTAASHAPFLMPSAGTSPWPVDGESRAGLWIRLEPSGVPDFTRELIDSLRVVVDHEGRTQVLTGSAFSPVVGGGGGHQTRYLYTPTSGALFVTLQLRAGGRRLFPDTQRIELSRDCWHMLSYRVRGPAPLGVPVPPPYPRTTFLSPAQSLDPPLFLDVSVSEDCFTSPLPPS